MSDKLHISWERYEDEIEKLAEIVYNCLLYTSDAADES